MAINLKGYTALITGGSSGMGFEMAKELLSHGATVIITARAGKRLDDAKTKLAAKGYDIYAVPMDVTSEESVTNTAKWVEDNFNHLNMVVNNAGIGSNAPGMKDLPADHHFYDIPISTVRAVIDTNFIGYFIVTSKFVPLMLKRGNGSLVYVSTSTSTMTRKGQLPYGPSKAGAEAMTTIIADELRDMGIMANVICPGGFTDTGMADEEFIVAGYIQKGERTFSLVLAKYRLGSLVYKGHVTSGVTKDTVARLEETGRNPFRMLPTGNENAVWVEPGLVCVVEYMPNTLHSLRQPVFKGFRDDIFPEEVQVKNESLN